MRYNKIRKMDISNGDGIRVSLFLQGCHFHCKGCFNQETWDFNGGKEFTKDTIETIIELCKQPYIQGLSILGGEPLEPVNCVGLQNLLWKFKMALPDKDIWLWTGYKYEDLNDVQQMIILWCDRIITGPFIESLKDPTLKWRGSSNQEVWIRTKSNIDSELTFVTYE